MDIAEYKVNIRFDIARREWTRLDAQLKALDRRLSKFNQGLTQKLAIKFDKFDVDQRRLNFALGSALDIASRTTTFNIERFNINQQALNRAMARATAVASSSATVSPHTSARGISGRHAVAAGGIGGLAARAYLPALALAGGGYGLGLTNRRNQEVVSAQLQSQAVVQQAGGTAEQGRASFDYLRSQADRIGFNYLDSSADYNKLLSGLTGSGLGLEESQRVFTGFAEIARTNKLDKVTQNRLFRALSQVAGKGKLQAEELTGQIAEALPGGTALFARAYQAQTGGNLTGQAAIQALMENMKKGQVNSGILTYAAADASRLANAGGALTSASTASQAEQARFQNRYNDLAMVASNSGLESGFARLFRALSDGLSQSNGGVESLARGFDNVSKYVSSIVLATQSLQRFFDGKDSYLGDKFFPTEEDRATAYTFLESFKQTSSEISRLTSNIYSGWSQLIGLIDGSSGLKTVTNALNTLSSGLGAVNRLAEGDYSGAQSAAKDFAIGTANTVTAPGRFGANAILSGVGSDFRFGTFGETQTSWQAEYKAEQARLAQDARNQYTLPGINQAITPGTSVDVKLDVTIQAANPEDFNNQFQEKFKAIIGETMLQYSEKE